MSVMLKSKKTMMLFGMIASVIVLGVWVGIYLKSPSKVISLDINPSMEIHTNQLGQVVFVEPVNEDAKQVMAGYQLTDHNLENVINDIVDRLLLAGYLTSPDTNEIMISGDASGSSATLVGKINTTITDYLNEKHLEVKVLQQKLDVDKEDIEEAHANHISVGKMAMINKLVENNKELSVEELSDASVKQLMQYFDDQNITKEELEKEYAIITSIPTIAVEEDASEGQNILEVNEDENDDRVVFDTEKKEKEEHQKNEKSELKTEVKEKAVVPDAISSATVSSLTEKSSSSSKNTQKSTAGKASTVDQNSSKEGSRIEDTDADDENGYENREDYDEEDKFDNKEDNGDEDDKYVKEAEKIEDSEDSQYEDEEDEDKGTRENSQGDEDSDGDDSHYTKYYHSYSQDNQGEDEDNDRYHDDQDENEQ